MCTIASSAIFFFFLYNLFECFCGSLNCDEALTDRDNPGGLKIKTALQACILYCRKTIRQMDRHACTALISFCCFIVLSWGTVTCSLGAHGQLGYNNKCHSLPLSSSPPVIPLVFSTWPQVMQLSGPLATHFIQRSHSVTCISNSKCPGQVPLVCLFKSQIHILQGILVGWCSIRQISLPLAQRDCHNDVSWEWDTNQHSLVHSDLGVLQNSGQRRGVGISLLKCWKTSDLKVFLVRNCPNVHCI